MARGNCKLIVLANGDSRQELSDQMNKPQAFEFNNNNDDLFPFSHHKDCVLFLSSMAICSRALQPLFQNSHGKCSTRKQDTASAGRYQSLSHKT